MLKVIAEEFGLSGTATGFITSTYFFLYVAMQVRRIVGDRLGAEECICLLFARRRSGFNVRVDG